MAKHFYIPLCIIIIFSSCDYRKTVLLNERGLELDQRYTNIENIMSIADCNSPDGKYTTEIHSSKSGYTYFTQTFGSDNQKFEVVARSDSEGYTLDENGAYRDTLSKENIHMIKGHEFHKMHVYPDMYYDSLSYIKNEMYQGEDSEKFIGTDKLNNPVTLFYNRNLNVLKGIKLINSLDSTQQIEIIYNSWSDSEFGKMVKDVIIIQAEKDTFTFNFNAVKINEVTFTEK